MNLSTFVSELRPPIALTSWMMPCYDRGALIERLSFLIPTRKHVGKLMGGGVEVEGKSETSWINMATRMRCWMFQFVWPNISENGNLSESYKLKCCFYHVYQ